MVLVLRDPVLYFSYPIYYILYCWLWCRYYIYCVIGYDAGGYIVGGVAGAIYYIVAGGVTSCSCGVVGVGVIVCFIWCYLCNVGIIGGAGVVGVGIIGLCFWCIFWSN